MRAVGGWIGCVTVVRERAVRLRDTRVSLDSRFNDASLSACRPGDCCLLVALIMIYVSYIAARARTMSRFCIRCGYCHSSLEWDAVVNFNKPGRRLVASACHVNAAVTHF